MRHFCNSFTLMIRCNTSEILMSGEHHFVDFDLYFAGQSNYNKLIQDIFLSFKIDFLHKTISYNTKSKVFIAKIIVADEIDL